MDFNGKNILIVGGTSGIGLALQQNLRQRGANVWVASRREPADGTPHIPLDVTAPADGWAAALPDTLHGVAYCPGSINLKPFARLSEDDFNRDWQVNVMGAVRVLQAAVPALKKAQGASVVVFSTVAARTGLNFHASIAAAKGALEGLALSLAAEYAGSRIRFNAVAPSLTDTPLAGNLLSSPEKREASDKRHPLGRVGTAAELASLAAFLLSDQAGWITGQVLHADGGLSSLR
ncbi:MAG: SDR family oxidoreductase [Cytophagales bacterium]|jgi:NAD(P)-dependent dehydrogenase (short-subunit alcohol dehydrogenase family)|nr:SDR family oxidoreductase [Cytophagales bacterium]